MPEEKTPAVNADETQEGGSEENQDLSPEDEEFLENLEEEDLENATEEEMERIRKALPLMKTAIAQKKHWRGKYQTLESSVNKKPMDQEPSPQPEKKEAEPKKQGADVKDEERFAKLEFKQDHPDLAREEIEEIFAYAKVKAITPNEAIATPVMKAFLSERKERNEVEGASPEPKGGGSSMKAKTVDFSRMPKKQLEDYRNKIRERSRQ